LKIIVKPLIKTEQRDLGGETRKIEGKRRPRQGRIVVRTGVELLVGAINCRQEGEVAKIAKDGLCRRVNLQKGHGEEGVGRNCVY
jgi:hypothetical protein